MLRLLQEDSSRVCQDESAEQEVSFECQRLLEAFGAVPSALPPGLAASEAAVFRLQEEVTALFERIDVDHDGRITFSEFSAAVEGSELLTALLVLRDATAVRSVLGGIGARSSHDLASARAKALAEVRAVPAFVSILAALDEHARRIGKPGGSPSTAHLARVATASPRDQKAYVSALGVIALVWLWHVDAHAYFATRITEDSGLTVAIVALAVRAAAEAVVRKDAAFRLDESGSLEYAVPQARERAGGVRP